MGEVILTGVFGLIGMFITGYLSYKTAEGKDKKDFTINDRQLLSEDERQFRTELKEELERNREQIGILQKEVQSLRKLNMSLELENKQLQMKIDQLRNEMLGQWAKENKDN